EPLGDIDKAEPDKTMVGTWAADDQPAKAVLTVEMAPEVKGNPKGLMRMIFLEANKDLPVWFFLTTVGKEHYGNLLLDANTNNKEGIAMLDKEGEYAKWSKGTGRRYYVFHYTPGKDGFVLNFGDEKAVKKLMMDEKIEMDSKQFFKTPVGWLAKYLQKN